MCATRPGRMLTRERTSIDNQVDWIEWSARSILQRDGSNLDGSNTSIRAMTFFQLKQERMVIESQAARIRDELPCSSIRTRAIGSSDRTREPPCEDIGLTLIDGIVGFDLFFPLVNPNLFFPLGCGSPAG